MPLQKTNANPRFGAAAALQIRHDDSMLALRGQGEIRAENVVFLDPCKLMVRKSDAANVTDRDKSSDDPKLALSGQKRLA